MIYKRHLCYPIANVILNVIMTSKRKQ